MKKLTTFFRQLQLRQILTVFLATVILFVGTACNNGSATGARPNNLPVQMGGSNNPYKSGGDTNTNFNLSPDPKMSGEKAKATRNQASVPTLSNQLIAAVETLYPGAESPANRPDVEKALPKKTLQDYVESEPGGQNQRRANYGDRIQERLTEAKEAFDEAGEFITEDAQEALQRHEEPGLR
jgi:hypothetical protein